MAADLFSLYALDNIGEWIRSWIRDYERGYENLKEITDFDPDEHDIPATPSVAHAFAGYTVQQYQTKAMKGALQKVNAYDRYKKQIPDRVQLLLPLASPELDEEDLDLGIVPNMFSMVPLAQANHAPIRDLEIQDGLRGAQVSQKHRYAEQLEDIAGRLVRNLGLNRP